jgi:hypothetical protein
MYNIRLNVWHSPWTVMTVKKCLEPWNQQRAQYQQEWDSCYYYRCCRSENQYQSTRRRRNAHLVHEGVPTPHCTPDLTAPQSTNINIWHPLQRQSREKGVCFVFVTLVRLPFMPTVQQRACRSSARSELRFPQSSFLNQKLQLETF